MLTSFVVAAVLTAPLPQPAAPACTLLTTAEVTALIGAGAKPVPITNAPNGSSCMLQNGDHIVTVLISKQTTPDATAGLFAAKKRVVAGQDVSGWATKAYAGVQGEAAVVGLEKATNFIEVKTLDKTQKTAHIAQKLRTVMKAVSARM